MVNKILSVDPSLFYTTGNKVSCNAYRLTISSYRNTLLLLLLFVFNCHTMSVTM